MNEDHLGTQAAKQPGCPNDPHQLCHLFPGSRPEEGYRLRGGKRRTLAKYPHQVQHTMHIAPVKDAPVDHRPTTLVISTDHLHQVTTEIVPEPVQVGCTEVDVIHEPIRVTAYASTPVDAHSGVGHKLHNTNATIPRNHMLMPATLLPCNGQ